MEKIHAFVTYPVFKSKVTKGGRTDYYVSMLSGNDANWIAFKLDLPLGLRASNGVWTISKKQYKKARKLGARPLEAELIERNNKNTE